MSDLHHMWLKYTDDKRTSTCHVNKMTAVNATADAGDMTATRRLLDWTDLVTMAKLESDEVR